MELEAFGAPCQNSQPFMNPKPRIVKSEIGAFILSSILMPQNPSWNLNPRR